MSLAEKVSMIIDDFENASSTQILEVLEKMMPEFKSNLTSEYLQGKMQKILDLDDESEKKKQCKALMPYLDWYLQGL
ncbi:hypothetical protein [Nitrosopumilus adriaticus]|uniref:Uncharacterized protein n=1 Tax=Nitrosopumilus adriaticus TaxID=1580092 RepID=A0A0D5C2S3_9ARCH|nr:hypothetical protein [Nitrosopumilus adriaticus]AJW71016.1 hypothetical protein NADRNF5_1330 [Nitrosopumilus adriaticus]